MSGLLGQKIGMTQIFDENGLLVPVTVVQAGPCYVTQIKTKETDGYDAVQIAFGEVKEKRVTKPLKGHFAKAKVAPKRHLMEFDFSDVENVNVGDEIKVDIFQEGSTVRVSGVSKGKGFQGVVKRHGFGGGPKTHGQSDRLRAPGSIGQSSYPSRVFKGLKMAGRMGGDRITVKNVEVVKVDVENNLLFLKGPLPGSRKSLLEIRK
ncbi:MAG TPA: 50S ribosomal protein L3 [Caldithrix abyssi]|uniref:Large ribosomal subunit protein uL3 n=1 Tax=Caldithrix abyssi TaxID=187145 RepID=A0A7V5PN38_CALAY|nr:50S ribosomal protein L3 [Caldithrix abyssi]